MIRIELIIKIVKGNNFSFKDEEKLVENLVNRVGTSVNINLKYVKDIHSKFGDNSFDVVTMFDVIEHINNINEFLSGEVRRVLKQGGRLLFQTPNIYSNIPWEIFVHRSIHKYKEYHVSLQSYRSLNRLLKSAGFVEILIEKRDIRTPYYLRELKKYIGPFAYPVLSIGNLLPVRCATNFWGHCTKPSKN